MAQKSTRWFLSLQLTLHLVLIFVRGNEDTDDAYKNGRHLVLEYFLPINHPQEADMAMRRGKRDVEGSGEEDSVFSELKEKNFENADNSTGNTLARYNLEGNHDSSVEGSGELEEVSKSDVPAVPIIADSEVFTTTESDEVVTTTGKSVITVKSLIFDITENLKEITATDIEEITTVITEPTPAVISITDKEDLKTTILGTLSQENAKEPVKNRQDEFSTPTFQETTTMKLQTGETTTSFEEATTVVPLKGTENNIQTMKLSSEETTELPTTKTIPAKETTALPTTTTTLAEETTTMVPPTLVSVVIPQRNIPEEQTKSATDDLVKLSEITGAPPTPSVIIPSSSEGLPVPVEPPTTPKPIVEEIFKETKTNKKVEALPENILQNENLSLAADPLLIANTRLMDSEENVHLSSSEPKRLGAYIVIGLILLSFSSLVGYITFKKRMNRKRLEFESHQESNDTEKALLSLSDYKDNSELEENHLKNNEITPIVVKSNSQINKFEKNTNFSSPKNLNTIANEKNIEKDNVLKSTAENLTQVIIEDSPKDLEEDKNVPSMEKLIVKTRIDQDSIPKKPIIINRSSTGYLPIPQDNS